MTSKSKPRPNTSKNESWEKREARLLCKTVYDHLAYYIQVQLPEEKFVSTTRLQRLTSSTNPSEPSSNSRSITRSKRRGIRKSAPGISKKSSMLSNDSGSSNQRKSGNQTRTKPRSKQKSFTKESSTKNGNTKSLKCPDCKKMPPVFEKSPYLTDPIFIHPDRKKRTIGMRREAERVTSNATQLMQKIQLDEIMTVQKYRSPYKSLMRCSSSLSEHPNGMLTSNRAIKYAAEHDDREAAKLYVDEKRKMHRKNRKRHKERERRQPQISFNSYQSRYRHPPKIFGNSDESLTSDSDISDDEVSRLTSSMGTGSEKADTRLSANFANINDRRSSESSLCDENNYDVGHETDGTTPNIKKESILTDFRSEEESSLASSSLKTQEYAVELEPDIARLSMMNKQDVEHSDPKPPPSDEDTFHTEIDDAQICGTDLQPSTQISEMNESMGNSSETNKAISNHELSDEKQSAQSDANSQSSLPHGVADTSSRTDSSTSDDGSSTTSSIRRLIAEARSSLSVLGSSSDD